MRQKGQIKQIGQKYSGFSLMEMVIALAVASILVLAVGKIFLASTETHQTARTSQENLDTARSVMEIMAKNLRMSTHTISYSNGSIIYMYNSSQKQCVSYKFDSTKTILTGQCNPKTDATGKIVGSDGSSESTICDGSKGNPCASGAITPLTSMSVDNVTGSFFVPKPTSASSSPPVIGKATITMTIGSDTASQNNTLQTSVSFRDYQDIIQ